MNNELAGASNQIGSESELPDLDPFFGTLEIDLGAKLNRITNEIRTALLDPSFDRDELKLLWVEYALHTEKIIEQFLDPIEYANAQIAAILHKATIFRDAGDTSRYLEELYDAQEYAFNAGIDDVYQKISDQINLVIDNLSQST